MSRNAEYAGAMRAPPLAPVDEPKRIGVVVRCALAVSGVAVFFTNLDSYAAAAWPAPDPVVWVLAFTGASGALVLLDLHRPTALWRSPLLAWAALYFLVTTAWAIWTPALPEVLQELRARYRSIVFLLTFALLFDEPRARRAGVIAVAIGVAIGSVVNIAEFLSLVTFADISGRIHSRAAGFHINPNASGLAIALGLAVVAPALPRYWRATLLLLGAIGVVVTFSRGASICFALVFLWLIARGSLGPKYVALILFCAFLLFTYGAGYVQEHGLLDDNSSTRLRLEHDDSGRSALAMKAWGMFARAPLAGNGLASTRTWDARVQAHNMFLTLAADHGVVGLIVFPALALALIAARRRAAGFALALMAAGLTSHGMLASRYALLLTALAAASPRTTADSERFEEGADS